MAGLPLCAALALAASDSAIVKPPDGAWLTGPAVRIIAKGGEGRLLLDGRPLEAEEPFPGVFTAVAEVAPGRHSLHFESPAGTAEISFHSGGEPPNAAGARYVDHPPSPLACTHCHNLSRRGRFRFAGGCQSCHFPEAFIQTHSHQAHELPSCGMCHDAHGSAASNLLLLPASEACKQCHN